MPCGISNGITARTKQAVIRLTTWKGIAMCKFTVTYEIVTEESAENGESDEIGTVDTGLKLRDAIQEVNRTRTNMVDGVESVENSGRWWTVVNGPEFETGAQESRSLHPEGNITDSSRGRISRLIGARP